MRYVNGLVLLGILVGWSGTAAFWGCGSTAGDDFVGDPILSLHGLVTNEEALTVEGDIRVALIWIHQGERYFKVAQEAEINPEFPSFFKLNVYHLPPEEVLNVDHFNSIDGGYRRTTIGGIVAYLDGNDNQKMDLIPWESQESEDTVLGSVSNYSLWYLEGDPIVFPAPTGFEPFLYWDEGFSLRWDSGSDRAGRCHPIRRACRKRLEEDQTTSYCNDVWRACAGPSPEQPETMQENGTVPLDTELELPLSSDPYLAQKLCHRDEEFYHFIECFDPVSPETWPVGATRSCSEDGRSLIFSIEGEVSLCQANILPGDGTYTWPTEYPIPDWWPCEIEE